MSPDGASTPGTGRLGADPLGPDPLGTAGLRAGVLAAWGASPARFREDANAEQELSRGGYRDRAIVELAQNAADAGSDALPPVRLHLEIREETSSDGASSATLYAANTGRPLTPAGAQALSTLRASAKRDIASTGRFGVGFVAVLGLSSRPAIVSATGTVAFSAVRSAEVVAAIPGGAGAAIRDELVRRSGQLPVLRLPFPDIDDAAGGAGYARELLAAGYDTVVRLPLDRPEALEQARAQLAGLDDTTLLALPRLGRITVVDGEARRELADVASRWRIVRREGSWDEEALSALPTEDRERRDWWLLWALPKPYPAGSAPVGSERSSTRALPNVSSPKRVVYAPTPTEEPVGLPGVVLGSFPVESSRRRLADSAATHMLLDEAGGLYAELLAGLIAEEPAAFAHAVGLIPGGLPGGPADARLQDSALRALAETAWLPAARTGGSDGPPPGDRAPGAYLRRPDRVVMVRGPGAGLAGELAGWVPEILVLPDGAEELRSGLRRLGVTEVDLPEVLESIGPLGDADFRRLCDVLAGASHDPLAREGMSALSVPMSDGGTRRGARGARLPSGDLTGEVLGRLGVVTVAADASHPLLSDLGAVPATVDEVLTALDATLGRELLDEDALPFEDDGSLEDDGPLGEAEHSGEAPSSSARGRLGAVLIVVRQAAGRGDGRAPLFVDHPWLTELPLADETGATSPAGDLFLPGGGAEGLVDEEDFAAVADSVVRAWGGETLLEIGVQGGPRALAGRDLTPGEVPEAGLAAVDLATELWLEELEEEYGASDGSVYVPEVTTVGGLDVVPEGAWHRALLFIDADPELRRALLEEVPVIAGDRQLRVPGPALSWLRREVRIDGATPAELVTDELHRRLPFLPRAPEWAAALSAGLRDALFTAHVREVGAAVWADALDGPAAGLADRVALWSAIADSGALIEAPERLLALTARDDDGDAPGALMLARVPTGEAFIAEAPFWLQRTDLGGVLRASWADPDSAARLADALDLPLGGEIADGAVRPPSADDGAVERELPADVVRLLAGLPRASGVAGPGDEAPPRWFDHDVLLVDGVRVSWWVDGAAGTGAVLHSCDPHGFSRALAWASGRWQHRDAILAVASGGRTLEEVVAELG